MKEIAETSHMRSYEKGAYIATPHDEEKENIYFQKKGEVEIYETTPDGRKITIDMLQPGDIFGYANITDGGGEGRKQFIRASENATICIMPRDDFLALLEKKPDLALKLIRDLSLRLSNMESKLRDTALGDAETRVFQELERLAIRYSVQDGGRRTFTRKFTHEELAHLVGTTRETVIRTLARLCEQNRITIDEETGFIHLEGV